MSFVKDRNKLLGEKVINSMKKRKIDGFYVENKEEALKKILELIEEGSTVTWGGCQSGIDIGLFDIIKKGNYNILDRADGKNQEETFDIAIKAMKADYYIMSANAISADGVLYNIDGLGNRVAALAFGPKNIIVVAGINKVEPNEESAMARAKNTAAPINNVRFDTKNPCTVDGLCHNCLSDNCICCTVTVTRFSRLHNRIKVVLVGEELGF